MTPLQVLLGIIYKQDITIQLIVLHYYTYYWVIIDALACKQHFNAVAYRVGPYYT